MTLASLYADILQPSEQFASETARLSSAQEHQPAHAAASILSALIHALDQAVDGRPELLLALSRRLGYPLSISELVGR